MSLAALGIRSRRTGWAFVLFFSAIVAILVGVPYLVSGLSDRAATSDTLANGVTTTASVVSVEERYQLHTTGEDTVTYVPTVRFTTADGTTVEGTLPAAASKYDYGVGVDVEVIYNASDPASRLVLPGVTPADFTVPIITGAVLIVGATVAAIFGFRLLRRDSHRS